MAVTAGAVNTYLKGLYDENDVPDGMIDEVMSYLTPTSVETELAFGPAEFIRQTGYGANVVANGETGEVVNFEELTEQEYAQAVEAQNIARGEYLVQLREKLIGALNLYIPYYLQNVNNPALVQNLFNGLIENSKFALNRIFLLTFFLVCGVTPAGCDGVKVPPLPEAGELSYFLNKSDAEVINVHTGVAHLLHFFGLGVELVNRGRNSLYKVHPL